MQFPLLILMSAVVSATLSLFMAPWYNLTMCEILVPGFPKCLGDKGQTRAELWGGSSYLYSVLFDLAIKHLARVGSGLPQKMKI